MPLKELVDKKKLYNVPVRMCRYNVVGEKTQQPSNKIMRIVSDHAFAEDWHCKCTQRGSTGNAHFDHGKDMNEVRIVEPNFFRMRIDFAREIVKRYPQ